MDRSGKKVCIRREIREDLIAIRRINEKAFGGIQEVNLVDDLRPSGSNPVSLVALLGGQIVGHILFSPRQSKGRTGSSVEWVWLPWLFYPNFRGKGSDPHL